jgi:hypothetical protein
VASRYPGAPGQETKGAIVPVSPSVSALAIAGASRRGRLAQRADRKTGATVYAPGVSDKPPQTYILHTVVLFVVLVAAMVVFLIHQWG